MFTAEQLPAPEGFENVTPEERNDFLYDFLHDFYWEHFYLQEYSPLLDYVSRWAEEFHPNYDDETGGKMPSVVPFRFFLSYFRKEIPQIKEIKTRYERSKEMLETLDAYNIDKSKYFYLCLMLKYYIDVNYTNTYTITPTHIEVIKKFIDKLDEMNPDKVLWQRGHAEHGAELTLKVDGIKDTFKTNDKVFINVINYCISKFYYDHKEDEFLHSHNIKFDKIKNITKTEKAYLFYHYLKWFLKDKKLGKRTLDKSKELLISRSYYVFEISENLEKDTYYTYHKGNPLRDLIKNCNDPRKRLFRNGLF